MYINERFIFTCTVALGAFYAVQRCSLPMLVSYPGQYGWLSWERGNVGLECPLDIMNGPYDLSRGIQKRELSSFVWIPGG